MSEKSRYVCYYNDMALYSKPSQIQAHAAEVMFYNRGTSTMVINGISFAPGTGISFDGKEGELDVTKYKLSFTGGGVNEAFVVCKNYTD